MTGRPKEQSADALPAVVFDLGGVLIDVDLQQTIAHWSQVLAMPVDRVIAAIESDTQYELLERGETDIAAYHRHLQELLGCAIGFDDFIVGWNRCLGPVARGAPEFIAALVGRARLLCLSNTNKCHADYWLPYCSELLAPFEKVFVSHEMGARKPEPQCYQQVLDYLQLPADRVVFFDDRQDNVAAAAALGIRSCVWTGVESGRAHLQATGLLNSRPR